MRSVNVPDKGANHGLKKALFCATLVPVIAAYGGYNNDSSGDSDEQQRKRNIRDRNEDLKQDNSDLEKRSAMLAKELEALKQQEKDEREKLERKQLLERMQRDDENRRLAEEQKKWAQKQKDEAGWTSNPTAHTESPNPNKYALQQHYQSSSATSPSLVSAEERFGSTRIHPYNTRLSSKERKKQEAWEQWQKDQYRKTNNKLSFTPQENWNAFNQNYHRYD